MNSVGFSIDRELRSCLLSIEKSTESFFLHRGFLKQVIMSGGRGASIICMTVLVDPSQLTPNIAHFLNC